MPTRATRRNFFTVRTLQADGRQSPAATDVWPA
jgi:hypothetical protein